jgi:hypothetical protein
MGEMGSPGFLSDLLEHGRVRFAAADTPAQAHLERGEELDRELVALDTIVRAEMPLEAPSMTLEPARWAAGLMYDACRLLVCRELGPEVVAEAFARRCPVSPSPGVCFSVDLVLRYLPGLISLCRGLAEDDPLLAKLVETAREWPLSSVGVVGIHGEIDVTPFIDDAALRQLYVDRIIESRDVSRLNDPRVADSVRAALGAFGRQLAPDLAVALDKSQQQQEQNV